MRKLLLKLFIKNYQDTTNEEVRAEYGKLSGAVGIFTNLLLAISKIIAGILASSVSILADGLNNLSDSFSSIATLVGFKLSSQPADKEHPFGHYRIEYVSGLIVSFIILMVGLLLFQSAIDKIINPSDLDVSVITIVILVTSILIKIWQCFFYFKNGKDIKSQALIALSQDSRNDVLSSTAVLITSLLFLFYPKINLDGYIGLAVSILVIVSGIKLVKATISPLIGEAPSKEFITQLNDEILAYPKVLGTHDLVIHKYGEAKIYMTAHIEVHIKMSLVESHELADLIEQDFLKKHNINLVVHIDPLDPEDQETMELSNLLKDILKEIDPILQFHDFRIVKNKKQTNMIFDLVCPFGFNISKRDLIEIINAKIKNINKNLHIIMVIDSEYMDDK